MTEPQPEMTPITKSTSKSGHLSNPIHIPHHVISPNHKRWHSRASSFLLAGLLFVCFCLAAAEVGLSSFLLQRYGNAIERWSNQVMLKHLVGLTLFNALWTLLFALGSYWVPPALAVFLLFANSMMWIVDAGLLNRASPMRAGHCDRGANFPSALRVECNRLVAMEAIAWTLWALLFFGFGYLLHRLVIGQRRKDVHHTLYGV